MKYFLMFALLFGCVSCDLFNDDPTTPPSLNKEYEIEFIIGSNATTLGWTAEIQYLGQPDGFMGRININTQDHTVTWNSRFEPTEPVQVRVADALNGEIAVFEIDAHKYTRIKNGVTSTYNEQGWMEYSSNIWHCQLDCR